MRVQELHTPRVSTLAQQLSLGTRSCALTVQGAELALKVQGSAGRTTLNTGPNRLELEETVPLAPTQSLDARNDIDVSVAGQQILHARSSGVDAGTSPTQVNLHAASANLGGLHMGARKLSIASTSVALTQGGAEGVALSDNSVRLTASALHVGELTLKKHSSASVIHRVNSVHGHNVVMTGKNAGRPAAPSGLVVDLPANYANQEANGFTDANGDVSMAAALAADRPSAMISSRVPIPHADAPQSQDWDAGPEYGIEYAGGDMACTRVVPRGPGFVDVYRVIPQFRDDGTPQFVRLTRQLLWNESERRYVCVASAADVLQELVAYVPPVAITVPDAAQLVQVTILDHGMLASEQWCVFKVKRVNSRSRSIFRVARRLALGPVAVETLTRWAVRAVRDDIQRIVSQATALVKFTVPSEVIEDV